MKHTKEAHTQVAMQSNSETRPGENAYGENRPAFAGLQQLQQRASNSVQVSQLKRQSEILNGHTIQRVEDVIPNRTGLPNQLKSGIENLSGYSMDDVKVHYNSSKPADLNAHAYAQGTDIHIASGQEKHLPHEAWHVVQQKQGRVKPTRQLKGKVAVNDEIGLEQEADEMGEKALSVTESSSMLAEYKGDRDIGFSGGYPIQRKVTIRNADFSEVTAINFLGGVSGGAYRVSDNENSVVVKVVVRKANKDDLEPDFPVSGTALALNLADDFGIRTPDGAQLVLDSPQGRTLKEKASKLNKKLEGQLATASSVILWEDAGDGSFAKLNVLGQNYNETQATAFAAKDESFEEIGRMIVYDAAIINGDRIRMEGELNSGNILLSGSSPVAIDQDFGKGDPTSSMLENVTDASDDSAYSLSGKMKPYFQNPKAAAEHICGHLISKGYEVFKGKEALVEKGLRQGLVILQNLSGEDNERLQELLEWSSQFDGIEGLNTRQIKSYWRKLLGE